MSLEGWVCMLGLKEEGSSALATRKSSILYIIF
jgi:hypothetical protein